MRSARIALAAGLLLTAAALAAVLSRAPLVVAATNGVPAHPAVAYTRGGQVNCSAGATVPRGTEAIRLSLSANTGPRISLELLSGPNVVAEGTREAGWGVAETVTVPIGRVAHAVPNARVCATLGSATEAIQINGARLRTVTGRRAIALRIEYLRPGASSWLALAGSVARHLGVAHAPHGSWVAYLVIAVMLSIFALVSSVLVRELG
jgi:hypothetical protein